MKNTPSLLSRLWPQKWTWVKVISYALIAVGFLWLLNNFYRVLAWERVDGIVLEIREVEKNYPRGSTTKFPVAEIDSAGHKVVIELDQQSSNRTFMDVGDPITLMRKPGTAKYRILSFVWIIMVPLIPVIVALGLLYMEPTGLMYRS
ncbi:MAG: hypothetical protein AAFQ68_24485 [Bacteroidota bacterium]